MPTRITQISQSSLDIILTKCSNIVFYSVIQCNTLCNLNRDIVIIL